MSRSTTDKFGYEVVTPAGRPYARLPVRGGLLSLVAAPGAALYRVCSERMRSSRLRRRQRTPDGTTIVSIGNLEVGGNGKTPLAIHLIEHLIRAGYRPVYVSRAFKSRAERIAAVTVVVPQGHGASPPLRSGVRLLSGHVRGLCRDIGDEGAMVAVRCPSTPLLFHRDRKRAIALAREAFQPTHIILDDAFQTWAVERDLDVVLLDAAHPLGNGRLLPAGTLRETPEALQRADCIGINGFEGDGGLEESATLVSERAGKALPVFGIRRRLQLLDPTGDPVTDAPDGPTALVSSIARPRRFEGTMLSLGVEVALSIRYPDHHGYEPRDLDRCRRLVEDRGIATIVTTEKDWVKLSSFELPFARILIARLELETTGYDIAAQVEKPQHMAAASR
jgi:tetraacyldisaccharide 4'-kinase